MSSVLAESDLDSLSKRRARELEQRNRRFLRKRRAEDAGWHQSSREAMITRILKNITKQENESDEQLQQRLHSRDLLVSLFSTALYNYRRASVCDPFPSHLIDPTTHEKLFEQAELYMKGMPDVHHFAANPRAISNLPQTGLMLLDWILHPEHDGLSVSQIPLDQFKREFEKDLPRYKAEHLEPQYVFKIDYSEHHDYAHVFNELKERYGALRGYHGSSFENLHSIVRNGLDATYAKETSLFGTGIYLSSDRDVAYGYLKPVLNCGANSVFGSQVGCIVCCDVARHPDVKHASKEQLKQLKEFSIHSENDVPRGYIVAPKSEFVLVKYVLVYCNFAPVARKKTNFCQLMLVMYILVILFIWLVKSKYNLRLFFNQRFFFLTEK
jgi:hypothetical protein